MKVFVVASVVVLFAVAALAAPSVHDNKIESVDSPSSTTFSRAARFLGSCFESDDMATCLAVKGITTLNRAARSNNIEIISGVTFTRDPASPVGRSGKALSEKDVISQLPQAADERSGRLMDMAMQSAVDFFATHNLEVKVPAEATQEVARAIDEGRGKMKKLMGPLALAIGAKVFALLPILLGGLALLTTKAIIIAKIALLLALAVGSTRLFGAGGLGSKFGGAVGGGYNANVGASQGWSSAGSSASYPYARSLNTAEVDAQQMAYAGQMQH